MDTLTVIGIVGVIVGIIAGVVQILDYLQKRRRRAQAEQSVASVEQEETSSTLEINESSKHTKVGEDAESMMMETEAFDRLSPEQLEQELSHRQELVQIRKTYLRELQRREAERGSSFSVADTLEMQNVEKEVQRLEQEITYLETKVGEHTTPSAFPNEIPHNLPPRSNFVGREKYKDRIHKALQSSTNLIVVDGIGGIGKSALVLEIAYECLHVSQDGGLTNSVAAFDGFIWTTAKDRELVLDDILDIIAQTLERTGILQKPKQEKETAIQRLLRTRPYLLIVDSFEAIRDDSARRFLLNLPEPSKALITTRKQQALEARMISLKRLTEPEALLLARDEGKRLDLKAMKHASEAVLLQLYKATGGAPLAIKWAVGQIKQKGQSLDTVLAALHEARGNLFDDIFSRSWNLLSTSARQVLAVMPIFATSASKAGLEAASDVHHLALDQALGQLVEMSLVNATDELDVTRRRYDIHSLTRSFAAARFDKESRVRDAVQERLAKFFEEFTREHGEFGNQDLFAPLEPEWPNILTTIRWCWENQLDSLAADIFDNTLYFLISRGYWNDAMELGQQAITNATEREDEHIAARFRVWPVSWIERHRGNLDEAERHATEALSVLERCGVRQDVALAKRNLARIAQERGDLVKAEKLLREALEIRRQLGDKTHAHALAVKLARVALGRGDIDAAWALCNEILSPVRHSGSPDIIAGVLEIMSCVAQQRGDLQHAKGLCEEAVVNRRQAIRPDTLADVLVRSAKIEIEMGQTEAARQKLLEAREIYRKLDVESSTQKINKELLDKLGDATTGRPEREEGYRVDDK